MIRRCICCISLLGAFALPLGKLHAAPVNFFANLSPVNDSGVTGTASLTLDGNSLTVLINATGLEVGQIHPQHIHGFVDGNASSKNFTDFNNNGLIDEFESELATGPAIFPLTNSADFMANPLTDFPTTSDGSLNFSQTYTLTDDMLAALNPDNRRAIVLKGITEGGTYNPMLPVAAGLVQSAGGPPNGIPLPPAAWAAAVTIAGLVVPRMRRQRPI
jgi:hypothetical protein